MKYSFSIIFNALFVLNLTGCDTLSKKHDVFSSQAVGKAQAIEVNVSCSSELPPFFWFDQRKFLKVHAEIKNRMQKTIEILPNGLKISEPNMVKGPTSIVLIGSNGSASAVSKEEKASLLPGEGITLVYQFTKLSVFDELKFDLGKVIEGKLPTKEFRCVTGDNKNQN